MPLRSALHEHQVRNLDLSSYVAAEATTPVRDVVDAMARAGQSAALITREGSLAGIFTKRDVLRKAVAAPEALERPVSELMTPNPVKVRPETTVVQALRLMNTRHLRDVPVVTEEGAVIGHLTDYSLVRHVAEHLPAEVLNLPPDPNQVPKAPEGA
jgi:CBS domain-containing protein